MLKTRQTCRACKCPLKTIFDLGEYQIIGYSKEDEIRKVPLVLSRCDPSQNENACGLVQLKHTTPSYLLYSLYYYRSGINKTMTDHLYEIGGRAINISRCTPDDIIIDIGCNDGTFLEWFRDAGWSNNLYGFDPAANMAQYSESTGATIIKDFFSYGSFVSSCDKQAKLISSIAMFYDLEFPHDFVRSISMCLSQDGVWVLELAYLPATLSQNAFDTVCHEHLEYYCLSSLESLLHVHNLEVIDVYLNDINGGSFQVYVSHKGKHIISDDARDRIYTLRRNEFDLRLEEDYPYDEFIKRVNNNCEKLISFVDSAKKEGLKIYAYGASTKGAITLQYCGFTDKDIIACADRNPEKFGKIIAGTNIPIVSEEEARLSHPDYFLVLPWHFMPEFLSREKDFLYRGGKFIQPMPEFKIIGQNDL